MVGCVCVCVCVCVCGDSSIVVMPRSTRSRRASRIAYDSATACGPRDNECRAPAHVIVGGAGEMLGHADDRRRRACRWTSLHVGVASACGNAQGRSGRCRRGERRRARDGDMRLRLLPLLAVSPQSDLPDMREPAQHRRPSQHRCCSLRSRHPSLGRGSAW